MALRSGKISTFFAGKRKRNWFALTGLGFLLTIFVLVVTQDIFFEFTPLRRFERSTVDWRFHYRGPLNIPKDSLKVVIVEITQESFKSFTKPYPWPRSYYAHVIRNLKRAGVRAIGIDIIFSQKNAADSAGDEDMRNAIKETGIVVVAGKTLIASEDVILKDKSYGTIFFDADSSVGIAYTPNDEDGVYRRYQPFSVDPFDGTRLPSLAFGTLNKAFHFPSLYTVENTPSNFKFGDVIIPKADETSISVNYYGVDATYPIIPFDQVIDDSSFVTRDEQETGESINMFDDPDIGYLANGFFKDKIVLIGSRMPEEKDMFPVPIKEKQSGKRNLMYGVEIHANVIQNVLDRNFLSEESALSDVFAIIFFCAGTLFILTKFKSINFKRSSTSELLGSAFILLELGGIFLVSFYLFKFQNYIAVISHPVLAVVIGYVGSTVYNYLTERKQKAQIKNLFGHYLNPNVINELMVNPDKIRLGGERRNLSVLFSDIAGFTSISEKYSPEDLVALLNEYLSEMTRIIFETDGTLDKFEGDAVMAFWGAPVHQEDHAYRICKAAILMQLEVKNIRERWIREEKPNLRIRIGVNTGEILVGNMGGSMRFDYTVIGDQVNLAARLEPANKIYKTEIIIGEKTYKEARERIIARELDKLLVVGKTEPVAVYELMGLKDEALVLYNDISFIEVYNEGLALFRERKWNEAIAKFEHVLQLQPNDGPSTVYCERARNFITNPPPPDWKGVFALTSKD